MPGNRLPAFATSDNNGVAVFTFAAVPNGRVWTGTVSIPGAPNTAQTSVQLNGLTIGTTFGINPWGPVQAYRSETLQLAVTGLSPNTQYTAVWIIRDEHESAAQEPPVAYGSILQINNTTVNPVAVSVTQLPPPPGTMHYSVQQTGTGAAVQLTAQALTVGLTLLADSGNTHNFYIGSSTVSVSSAYLTAGQSVTFPVSNANIVWVLGTSPDILKIWGA